MSITAKTSTRRKIPATAAANAVSTVHPVHPVRCGPTSRSPEIDRKAPIVAMRPRSAPENSAVRAGSGVGRMGRHYLSGASTSWLTRRAYQVQNQPTTPRTITTASRAGRQVRVRGGSAQASVEPVPGVLPDVRRGGAQCSGHGGQPVRADVDVGHPSPPVTWTADPVTGGDAGERAVVAASVVQRRPGRLRAVGHRLSGPACRALSVGSCQSSTGSRAGRWPSEARAAARRSAGTSP